ncbi:unnamed protein product, partial [Sphagnum troendelagicum]
YNSSFQAGNCLSALSPVILAGFSSLTVSCIWNQNMEHLLSLANSKTHQKKQQQPKHQQRTRRKKQNNKKSS